MDIDIEELTIKQVREIAKMAGGAPCAEAKPTHPYAGKVVLCRSRVAGVLVGVLVSKDGNGLRLKDSTRVWRWKGPETCSGLSLIGLGDDGYSRIDEVVPDRIVDEDTELYLCSEDAATNLRRPRWPK